MGRHGRPMAAHVSVQVQQAADSRIVDVAVDVDDDVDSQDSYGRLQATSEDSSGRLQAT